MSRIHLIGTIHVDIDGRQRLETLLDRLNPTVVGVEFDDMRLDIMRSRSDEQHIQEYIGSMGDLINKVSPSLRQSLIEYTRELAKIRALEYRASAAYCEKNNARLELIDLSFGGSPDELIKGMTEIMLEQTINERQLLDLEKLVNEGTASVIKLARESLRLMYQQSSLIEMAYQSNPEHEEISKYLKAVQTYTAKPDKSREYNSAMDFALSPERNQHMATRMREISSYYPQGNLAFVVGQMHLLPLRVLIKDLNPNVISLGEEFDTGEDDFLEKLEKAFGGTDQAD